MAEVDTSTYPRAAPPQQQNPLDTIGKIQGIQKNAIGIDQEKLKLVNQKWDYGSKVLGSLLNKPDLKGEDLVDAYQELVKNGVKTPDQAAKSMTEIPTLAEIKRNNPNATTEQAQSLHSQKLKDMTSYQLMKGASIIEQLNHAYGSNPSMMEGGNYKQPQNVYRGALQPTGGPIPMQLPVGTPGFDPNTNREVPIGAPSFSPGPTGRSSGYPGQGGVPLPVTNPNAPIQPRAVQTVPAPPLPANLRPPQQSAVSPGSPPFGQKGAEEVAGAKSGEMLAHDREAANNFQRRIFPLKQAIPEMETLGTKGTGPGTEAINKIKSFVLSNVPGLSEDTFKGLSTVQTFDKANKYMTDYVNQNGNTGTNDKLAAAFAGNPSVHISNAAATDVLKSALALERMKQAQLGEFEKTGLPANQYSRWAAQWNNQQDARAFGVDLITKEKRDKMVKAMTPAEYEVYKKSLGIAHRSKLTEVPKE